ncbi:MAG: SMI1/KNR4 family protein [Chryseobacterium gambrini]|nr:SMI1/KNR4 family protein [Chryseobacterium gambrini]
MIKKSTPPEKFEDFLYWIKETTEKRWENIEESKKDGNWWNHKHNLFEGAKWVDPLSDEEIDALEIKWDVKFPKDYRSFLKILHKVDKENAHEYEDNETGETTIEKHPIFHDWRNDKLIKEAFNLPFEDMKFDIIDSKQPCWLKSWGGKPSSNEERLKIFNEWKEKANIIIPINSNKFLISEPKNECNHIISTHGFDVILFSLNLREHLINILRWDLGLDKREYDEDDENPIPLGVLNAIEEIQGIEKDNVDDSKEEEEYLLRLSERREAYKKIPYWEEVILYYSSGWDSIGLKFPFEKFSNVQPILVANDVTTQKIFEEKK